MKTCPSCGRELPGEFPFCPFCAAPLAEQPPAAVQEERKVVSVLFCDLVGFTAASGAADPEDVRARIRPYHARLRQEIERYGGTVEKFVGDAVMAVFGAPIAHEDDSERAVRTGLRLLEAIDELNESDPGLELQVRVGITTGEAVVSLGARPERGEGIVTGDVVNTASRLQGAAPVNGIAVSEQTYRATERVFDYVPLEPVVVKGKAEPVAIYRPLAARARFGTDVTRTHATPLVGRDLEKKLLVGTFERSTQQRSCQLVTVVGEPGVGKSRLCAELFGYVEDRPELVTWRQGRCLPYGEGIAFWALGEIVKAECGILETDSPDEAASKLERALPQDDADLPWLRARLQPLVGAGGEPAGQEESFAAWRRFLGSLATDGPAVLVFEDLHWADPALLAFLEHAADWSQGVPLLLLCTARPEFHEQNPTWAGGLRNATTINLAPLPDEEIARLIGSLLGRAVLPAESQQALLERSGGNPLYAEEFVRLLTDRRELPAEMPDSVQALIAARLDTVTAERKSLLQDASVIGKVFWTGALAEMGDRDPGEVETALHELARKELVRPARSSSMAGEVEYGFWHGLVRDVCYGQIPRRARANRHRAAAAWIEAKAGERAEDLANVLAHHYVEALELAGAAGDRVAVSELEAPARRYLALAGERALALDVASAERSLSRALVLAPEGDPERGFLLERWAHAAHHQGRLEEAKVALEEAVALYKAKEEPVAAGRALAGLSAVLYGMGDPRRVDVVADAIALLEQEPPGPELIAAYAEQCAVQVASAAYDDAIVPADRAVDLARSLGLPEPAIALIFRGSARAVLGDRGGLNQIRRGFEAAHEQGRSAYGAIALGSLDSATWEFDGPAAAVEQLSETVAFCERRGLPRLALHNRALQLSCLAACGHVEEAVVAEADALAGEAEEIGYLPLLVIARSLHLRLLAHRGDGSSGVTVARQLVSRVRETGIPWLMAYGLAAAAQILASEHRDEASGLLHELADGPARYQVLVANVTERVRCALALSQPELAARLAAAVEPRTPLNHHADVACRAQLAELAGDVAAAATLYADAIERWRGFGDVQELAYALLGHGRCLLALSEPAQAEGRLLEARDLFAWMEYKPALAETEALLGGRAVAAS